MMIEFFRKLYKNKEKEFFYEMKENLYKDRRMFIVTANPEAFMYGEKDDSVKKLLLSEKTTVVADGIGIVKAAKMLNIEVPERIPGIDIAQQLLEFGNDLKKSIFLFGAKEEIVSKLVEVIQSKYPNAIISGYENGYVKEKQTVFDKIASLNPDVVLVALGIPQQELLIYNNLNNFNKGIFIGVGGSFDVLSGTKKRAPKIFRRMHLEWLYRILKEPKRFKRFFNSNVKYIFKIRKAKMS